MSVVLQWFGWAGFERPQWLVTLWAVPLLILLYFLRRRAVRQDVPFLVFWDRVFASRRRRPSAWRTVISLLLQLVILVAAALAAAGPFAESDSTTPIHTILVLDRSLPCAARGTRTLAEDVIATAVDLLPRLANDGSVRVVLAGDALVPLTADDTPLADLAERVAMSGPPAGAGVSQDVVTLARSVDGETRVVFVTPFEVKTGDPPPPRLVVVPAGPSPLPKNGGIRRVERSPDGRRLSVVVEHGGSARTLHMYAAEVVVGTFNLPASAEPSAEVSFNIPVGASMARLRLDPPDALPEDDIADLVLDRGAALSVLIAADRPTPLLDAALVSTDVVDTARSGRASLARVADLARNFDVTILLEAKGDIPLRAGSWILIDATAPEAPLVRESSMGEARATSRTDGVPWLSALDPAEWKIHRMASWKAQEGAEVLVAGSRGPLVTRFATGGVRGVAFSVAPDMAASTLPLLPAFPLMLRGALLEVGRRDRKEPVLVTRLGSHLPLSIDEAAAFTDATGGLVGLVRSPDGAGFLAPRRPGRYMAAGSEFAVAWLDHPALAARPPARATPWVEPARRSVRKPLAGTVLLAVVALLVLEWWTYHAAWTE